MAVAVRKIRETLKTKMEGAIEAGVDQATKEAFKRIRAMEHDRILAENRAKYMK